MNDFLRNVLLTWILMVLIALGFLIGDGVKTLHAMLAVLNGSCP